MNQMTASLEEVSRNTQQAASAAGAAEQETQQGQQVVAQTVQALAQLAGQHGKLGNRAFIAPRGGLARDTGSGPSLTVGSLGEWLQQLVAAKRRHPPRMSRRRAEALENDKRAGTVGFALTILQRRLASSPEAIYQSLRRRRERLDKEPVRPQQAPPLTVPAIESYARILEGSGAREESTTMVFVRALSQLLRDNRIGRHIVPIVADEARTFGMQSLFRQVAIYSPFGQLYDPEDRDEYLAENIFSTEPAAENLAALEDAVRRDLEIAAGARAAEGGEAPAERAHHPSDMLAHHIVADADLAQRRFHVVDEQLGEEDRRAAPRPPLVLDPQQDQRQQRGDHVEAAVDRIRHLSLPVPGGIPPRGHDGAVERRHRFAVLAAEYLLEEGQRASRSPGGDLRRSGDVHIGEASQARPSAAAADQALENAPQ